MTWLLLTVVFFGILVPPGSFCALLGLPLVPLDSSWRLLAPPDSSWLLLEPKRMKKW
jgi:hypothetical protein